MNTSNREPCRDGSAAAVLNPFPNFTAQGLDRLRQMYAALPPSRGALAALFAVQAAQTAPDEPWSTFFVETASAQLVWDERPTGTLTEDDAAWLLDRFDEAPSLEVMGVLARVLEDAQRLPSGFAAAVRQRAALLGPACTARAKPARGPVPYLKVVK